MQQGLLLGVSVVSSILHSLHALEMMNCKTGMILLNIATSPGTARSVDPTECTYNLHISRKIVVYYEEIKRECVRSYARQSMQNWCVCMHQGAILLTFMCVHIWQMCMRALQCYPILTNTTRFTAFWGLEFRVLCFER